MDGCWAVALGALFNSYSVIQTPFSGAVENLSPTNSLPNATLLAWSVFARYESFNLQSRKNKK